MPNSKRNEKKLGRGFSTILEQESTLQQQLEFIQKEGNRSKTMIATAQLVPNPFQPPKNYPENQLKELALSLQTNGFLMPILVRLQNGIYEIVSGEKRWRAAQVAALSEVPAIVENIPDEWMQQIALIESLQRDDITPLDEALNYLRLNQQHGLSHQAIAKQIGKSRVYVTNLIRIATLPSFVLQAIKNKEIQVSHARTFVGLSEVEMQHLLAQIIQQKLSVRQCEALKRKRDHPANQRIRITKKHVKIAYDDDKELEKILRKLQS